MSRVALMAVESTVENEIAQGVSQRGVALTYAMALRSWWPTNWTRVNTAILGKWGKRGLQAVKRRAWRLVEGREQP